MAWARVDTGLRPGRTPGEWLFDPGTAPWLLPLLAARRARLLALLALGLVAALAALVPPWLTKLVIDEGLMAGDAGALIRWSLALFGFGLLALGLGAVNSVLHMRASVDLLAEMRRDLAQAILHRSPAWRARHTTGDLMTRLDADAGEVQQFAFNSLLSGTGSLLRLVGGAIMLFVLSWQLALLALVLAPLELAFFAWARPRTEKLARLTRAERGGFAGRLAEMIAALPQIQAARAEGPVADALDRQQARLNGALIRAQLWGEVTRGAPMIMTAAIRAVVFLAGGLMVIRGDWPLGSLIAFVAYLGFLIGPMQSLIGLWHAQARVRAALDRIGAVLAPEPRPRWMPAPALLPLGQGRILFDGVAVGGGDALLLAGIDAAIPGGVKVRVAGESGIGKSSLLALLQRHADPAKGRITLDGVDLRALSREALREAVALVPQKPFVMRGTVADNLRLSNPDVTAAAMWPMLDLVSLTRRFAPAGGLDATLGEDGMTLSGGERQRLCLARALLSPFRVLVLDEALSEVDPFTVTRIIRGIDERWPTATRIIATHGNDEAHGPFDQTLDLARWRTAR